MEPLASKIRPKKLEDFIGQKHLTAENKPLYLAIKEKHLFPFILWGPPGCGKTTLAKIYAEAVDAEFFELSAVSTGKDEIKKIISKKTDKGGSEAKALLPPKPKLILLDEIHRFNKAQQDFLLPYMESGEITLVGATTENPGFEIIPPLLSRCRVFVLESLTQEELSKIIDRTGFKLAQKTKEWLINIANGDARQAINILENTHKLYKKINLETLKNAVQNKFLRFDKKGDEHYNTISAYIKSLRVSDPDAALYYLARMVEAGEDPKFIARRMVIFAAEDVGLAQPTALVVANEVFRAVEIIGLPECAINLAFGTAYLALAKKNRSAYNAYFEALADVKNFGNLPIPLDLRNPTIKLAKELGWGKNYKMYNKTGFLPEKLKNKKYFRPANKN